MAITISNVSMSNIPANQDGLSTVNGKLIVASDIAGTTVGVALTLGTPSTGIANLLTLANTKGLAAGEGAGISFVDNNTAGTGLERASIHMLVEDSPYNGAIKFSTGLGTPGTYNTGTMTERMRITGSGGISFGSSGTAYGTSGQVLTSNGNAPPTWQAAGGGAAAAGTLTGATLASGVTASSLTSVGTITSGVWNGTAIANANLANSNVTVGNTAISLGSTATTLAGLTSVISTGFTGALTGNATTATTLATPRNINGTSFDGSADITVTAAAGTLTGATLASGVTASSLTSVGTLSALAVTGTTTQTGALNLAGASSPMQVGGSAGTSGYVLTSAGAGVTPTWAAATTATLTNVLVVAKNGNDTTGNGSFSKPFLTIQKANDYAVANITSTEKISIMVAPGNYTEDLSITRLRTNIIGMASAMNNSGVQVTGSVTIAPTAAIGTFNTDAITFTELLLSGPAGSSNAVLTLAGGTVSYTFFGENLKMASSNASAKCVNVTNTSTAGIKFKLNNALIQQTGAAVGIALSNAYLAELNNTTVEVTSASAITSATTTLVLNRSTLSTVSGANVLAVTSGFGGATAATIGTTSFTNSLANGDGINIASGATVVVGTSAFSIGTTAGTGRAIKGVSGSVLLTAFNTIIPGTNVKKSSAIGAGDVPMTTAFTAA